MEREIIPLIGRHEECRQLTECLSSGRSEFVVVCGRRRVGKTFLIERFFKRNYDFSFVGAHRSSAKIQLRNFAKAFAKYSNTKPSGITDWFSAFDALEEYLESLEWNRKKVIFIDEMPWIDTQRSSFVEALENFWNGWANRRDDIVLIATGSATSWMADNLIQNQGGLHNRITRRIFLEPFTLAETEEYFKRMGFFWQRQDILECYMVTGGVPYYLSLMDPQLSEVQNIDLLCFKKNAPLRNEFNELYNALFSKAESYISIVELLYNHKEGLSKKDIRKLSNFSGKRLTTILNNLEQCSFIEAFPQFGSKSTMIYKLVDFYTLFYLKFLANYKGRDEHWWGKNFDKASVRSWSGLTFEVMCLRHHDMIKKALGISGIGTSVYTWKYTPKAGEDKGAQIDMLIERADKVIHLCEIKYVQGRFSLSSEYTEKLRERCDIFRVKTRTRKSVVHTFITSFGIGEGKNYGIVHSEVTMDDLFNS